MNKRLFILHLEDSPKDAEMIRAILDAEGIAGNVVRVDTREDFVAALEGGGFDLVLADYTLPSFDGLSALKITLEKSLDVPFIFCTGTLGEEVAIEAVKNGATDYVPKQNLQRLSACVQRAVGEAEERAQRKRAEEELASRYKELRVLQDISQIILTSSDMSTTLERILDKALSINSYDLGVIRLLDPRTHILEPTTSRGHGDPKNLESHRKKARDDKNGQFFLRTMQRTGTRVEENVPRCDGLRTWKKEGVQSAVIVPVRAEHEVLGVIQLGSRTPRKFSPDDIRVLEAIGSQMGVAVQKARLYDEAQQNLARIRALHEIELAITSTLDLRTMLDVLLEKTESLLPHIAASTVRLLNKETGELGPIACRNLPEEEWKAATAQAASRDIRRLLPNDDNSPVAIRNVQTEAGALAPDFLRKYGLVSGLRVPLTAKNEVLGVITFFTSEEHEFGREEIEVLSTLAGQGAIAIQNARLHEGTKQSLDQVRALHEIDKAISSTLDLGTVLNILLENIEIFLPIAAATTIRLLNHQTGELESLACRGLDEKEWKAQQQTRSRGRALRVIETKAPVTVLNLQADPQTYNPAIFESRGLVSYLGVPLIAKDEVLGVLSLYTNQEHDFTPEEIDFLDTLASQAAMAIHNASLYDEIKKRADELQQKTSALEKSNKVKTEFLGVMSHELRTPLNVIMGYADMILDGLLGELNAEQENGLQTVARQSKNLLSMVESILDATKIEADALVARSEKVNLTELLDELRQSHLVAADKEITLSWDYPDNLPPVETDAEKLRQILHNLINNALKFTHQGMVTVTARIIEGSVEFTVQDTGIGIDKKELPLIFDMFHQVDTSDTRAYEGVGLGLYIAKKLTELLGGRIEVESEVGKGSTFTVAIPNIVLSSPPTH